MAGLLYNGEGGYNDMGSVFPRRKKKKEMANYERGEMSGMHKMANGMMMSDEEMAAQMKKKMPKTMHPREAMKMMKSRNGY